MNGRVGRGQRRGFGGRAALATAAIAAAGCGGGTTGGATTGASTTSGGAGGNCTTSVVTAELTQSGIDKLDLVMMIDNSRSMADKQQILVETVPDLVRGVVNPSCIDQNTMLPSAQQPAGPTDPCPDPTSRRAFSPILDIHIGIVTSSIGGHGSDACPNQETGSCPGGATNATNNDMGHLVSRLDPCTGGTVATYQGKGFLAWDPAGKYPKDPNPNVHTTDLGAVNVDVATGTVTTSMPGFIPDFAALVLGAGQIGCGYESSIESWYRFLVDPDPYLTIGVDAQGRANPQGIDDVLLQQRKDFLRPSSLLEIVGLTDENDCSTKEYGQFYFVNQLQNPSNPAENFHLPKARSECATNPNDNCCRSCGQDQTGCPADPGCPGTLDAKTDDVNLRCWDTKRRFGIDFLYPIDRYVTGLTQPTVPNRAGEMAPNPIFSDLDPADNDSSVRDPSLVFLAYIVGVPWQDIARDPTDLTKGFKSASQLATADAKGHTTWDYIIGDPANYVPPLDPHMIESSAPRAGTDPITGATLAPPSTTSLGPAATWPDRLNGHEYTPGTQMGVQVAPDDLEYACIFDLPEPRDCTDPNIVSCDCSDPKNDNPLCDDNGAKGRTLQTRAKGYPGIRQLSLVKALGSQGIVGSICPAQLTDLSRADFGYRPAIGGIIDRLHVAVAGQCLPRVLTPAPDGSVACVIVEARNAGASCSCPAAQGRAPVAPAHQGVVTEAQSSPQAKAAGWNCFCEIPQATGADLAACQDDPANPPLVAGQPVNSWCYVDAATNPPTGNPQIVSQCPENDRRVLRFVGAGTPSNGATVFVACQLSDCAGGSQ